MWSFVHNRIGIALFAVVAMVTLGAGCTSGDGAGPRGAQPATNTPSVNGEASADGSAVVPTRWTTYRSEAMGLSIPYPEGWRVVIEDDGSVSFHESAPPSTDSEYPAEMWMDSYDGSIEAFLAQFHPGDILEQSEVIRSGRAMKRVVLRHDLFGTAISYIWADDGVARRVAGRADANLEYVVDHMEVAP